MLHPAAALVAAAAAASLGAMGRSDAQQISNHVYEQPVDVNVLPFATLQIVGNNVLHLDIPPAGSTIPASGVDFVVTGNAHATLTAEPDAFMEVGGPVSGQGEHGVRIGRVQGGAALPEDGNRRFADPVRRAAGL